MDVSFVELYLNDELALGAAPARKASIVVPRILTIQYAYDAKNKRIWQGQFTTCTPVPGFSNTTNPAGPHFRGSNRTSTSVFTFTGWPRWTGG